MEESTEPYIRLFWGLGFSLNHKPYIHTAYIGEMFGEICNLANPGLGGSTP